MGGDMKKTGKETFAGLTRRDTLKLSGLTLGGMAVAGVDGAGAECTAVGRCYPNDTPTQQYSYFDALYDLPKWRPLDPDEMRITFLGSMIPAVRRAQQEMSIFVEVGWDAEKNRALDQFVFDCGSGVCSNYGAAGIGYNRMDKVFLCHLHGDHMSDLSHIYCFGPSADRKSPLYVWGPGPSELVYTDPEGNVSGPYDDGTKAYCETLRKAMRWHSESFSFQGTAFTSYVRPTRTSWGLPVDPVPVGDDPDDDAYALVPIELPWRTVGGVAYDNPDTGVRITHFPVIHTRQGSIGYKLEWRGLSMIYTSDTKPETNCIEQAKNGGKGVDVFIHEMVPPPEVWAMKTLRLPAPLPYPGPDWWKAVVDDMSRVQQSSHTPQGAFGYLLSQIHPRPRLTIATHFPTADDTVECAFKSVQAQCPWVRMGHNMIWSFDLMTISVSPKEISQRKLRVNDFGWSPFPRAVGPTKTPKYWTWEVDENGNLVLDENGNPRKVGDPFAQIDQTAAIEPGPDTYCPDGY